MMKHKLAAAAMAGALLMTASPALALDAGMFANVLNRDDARKEKSEKILERKLENRVESEAKKAKLKIAEKKDSMSKGRRGVVNENYLRGVKRGWANQLSRFDQCLEDISAGRELTQRCTAMTEFRKLLDECKKMRDAGTPMTEQCKKLTKHLPKPASSAASSAATSSAGSSVNTSSAGSTTSAASSAVSSATSSAR
jgi:hypothetical protein